MSALSDSSLSRRLAASKKLKEQIPRINLTSVIIRVTQFLILGAFTLAYAMARPDVYLDIFIWPQNTVPPYTMTVYRNTSDEWHRRAQQLENRWDEPAWPVVKFIWNETKPPAGLSEKYVCTEDTRWNCTGEQWAATRIGWLDSWPFNYVTPQWVAGTVHIDRYIFWLLLVGGYLGLGHNVIVLIHAIEPSGTGFYKYSAVMDFTISIVFLLLGIFPLSIQRHRELAQAEYPSRSYPIFSPSSMYTSDLKPHQQYVFCMGWILWGLYTVTFLLNSILISHLERYKRLPNQESPQELRRAPPKSGHNTSFQSQATEEACEAATSSGYQVRAWEDGLDASATGSYSRFMGRGIEV